MFGGLWSAGNTPDPQGGSKEADGPAAVEDEATGSSTAPKPATFDIWGLTANLTNTMKAQAEGLVKTVQDTDWKGELMTFSKEVKADADLVKHKAEETVEKLPQQAESIRKNLEGSLAAGALMPSDAYEVMPAREVSNVHGEQTQGDTTGRAAQGGDAALDLTQVGSSLTTFSKSLFVGTKELIEQVRDAVEGEIALAAKENRRGGRGTKPSTSTTAAARLTDVPAGKYSWFESEVSAMQRDSSTYCDEPEDAEDYSVWKEGFSLEGTREEIDKLLSSNSFMAELQSRIVPIIVEEEDFWSRYFYRLHKLKQKEEQRLQVAKCAKTMQQKEELDDWGDDLDEESEKEDGKEQAACEEKEAKRSGGEAVSVADVGADELLALLGESTVSTEQADVGIKEEEKEEKEDVSTQVAHKPVTGEGRKLPEPMPATKEEEGKVVASAASSAGASLHVLPPSKASPVPAVEAGTCSDSSSASKPPSKTSSPSIDSAGSTSSGTKGEWCVVKSPSKQVVAKDGAEKEVKAVESPAATNEANKAGEHAPSAEDKRDAKRDATEDDGDDGDDDSLDENWGDDWE